MGVRWLTAFLDTPRGDQAAAAFWARVTGSTISSTRGEHDEYTTLLPADGDAYLRLQDVPDGAARTHLDVHVDDVRTELPRVLTLGAQLTADHLEFVVLRSPGGYAFCLVPDEGEAVRPTPAAWPVGRRSLVDQLTFDIPAEAFDTEAAFWAALTGWDLHVGSLPEFAYLARPAGIPLRLLLHRLGEPAGPVRAHLDLACDDVAAEVARHEDLGAVVVRRTQVWTTLRDPAGRDYCVTPRTP